MNIDFPSNASLVVSEEYLEPSQDCILQPGDVLLKCNGQDIVKKNGMNKSSKHRILTIFPCQFLLVNKMNDCKIGMLHNLSSSTPEYHLETEDGILVFPGRFEYPSTKFLSILCHPGSSNSASSNAATTTITAGGNKAKNATCVLTDMFDRILIFDQPILEPKPLMNIANDNTINTIVAEDVEEVDLTQCTDTSTTLFKTYSSQQPDLHNNTNNIGMHTTTTTTYCKHFGMSSLADPIKTYSRNINQNKPNKGTTSTKITRTIIKDDESIASDIPDEESLPKPSSLSMRKTNRRLTTMSKAISYKDDSDIDIDDDIDKNTNGDEEDDVVDISLNNNNNNNNNARKYIKPISNNKKTTNTKNRNNKKIKQNIKNNNTSSSDNDDNNNNNNTDDESDFEIPKSRKRPSISIQTKKSTTKKQTTTTTNNSNNKTKQQAISIANTKDISVDSDVEIVQDMKKSQENKQKIKSSTVKNKKLTTISNTNIITIDDD